MEQSIHILNQLGILTSFSIAKKVNDDEMKKFYAKHKKKGKTETQIDEMVHNEVREAIRNNKIPGLINSQEIAKEMGIDESVARYIPELNRFVMVISQKLMERKYNKAALCYFINSLVNVMSLTQEDFEQFHKDNNKENDDDDDEDDDDDDLTKF